MSAFDYFIIGSGPAGSTFAYLLSSISSSVVVIEERADDDGHMNADVKGSINLNDSNIMCQSTPSFSKKYRSYVDTISRAFAGEKYLCTITRSQNRGVFTTDNYRTLFEHLS